MHLTGQSIDLLVCCLSATLPSVHETCKGAVLASKAASGIAALVRDRICQQSYSVRKSAAQTSPNVFGTRLPFSTISVSLVDRDFQTNNQPTTILQTAALARGLDAVAYFMVCSHMGCGLTMAG